MEKQITQIEQWYLLVIQAGRLQHNKLYCAVVEKQITEYAKCGYHWNPHDDTILLMYNEFNFT